MSRQILLLEKDACLSITVLVKLTALLFLLLFVHGNLC